MLYLMAEMNDGNCSALMAAQSTEAFDGGNGQWWQ
jgi:hypothetical protein